MVFVDDIFKNTAGVLTVLEFFCVLPKFEAALVEFNRNSEAPVTEPETKPAPVKEPKTKPTPVKEPKTEPAPVKEPKT